MAKAIVNEQNGDITIDSERGREPPLPSSSLSDKNVTIIVTQCHFSLLL